MRGPLNAGVCERALRLMSAALLAGFAAATNAQTRPPPASRPSPDELLWGEIHALRDAQPETSARDERIAMRERLITLLEEYLTLYPGGPRRTEAVRLELQSLFEVGALGCGRFERLRERATALRRDSDDAEIAAEAAYWLLICGSEAHDVATTQPNEVTPEPATPGEADRLAAYIEHHPDSRHAPRLALELFDTAERNGDQRRMRAMRDLLIAHHPSHAITQQLDGRLARVEAVGMPMEFEARTIDGAEIRAADFRGRPWLIVVWRSGDAATARLLCEVENWRTETDAAIVGVSLDLSADACRSACRELGISWPQVCDGRGPASGFARQYGIRQGPLVFVIGRDGVLRGVTWGSDWRTLADAAIAD
ncbi:MAG: TlpA family protein disulfide reductase [Planctomycetota bacterium]|nr:MAG: TlpA family protein disulfide reductase [Planctomycetota bacterium]